MKKLVASGLLILCALCEISAQSNVAEFSKKFNDYQTAWPKAKLHLIFNQDKFSPGDTAFFKGYFLKEDLQGIAGKQILRFDLVDSTGTSKLHFLFSLINGIGQNQLVIPPGLPQGIYLATAQSSWMKNFEPAFIFKKQIAITAKNILEVMDEPELRVVVEGGHLIRDIPNKVIIRSNRSGPVEIVDAAGKLIHEGAMLSDGTMSFTLTPTRGTSYFVRRTGDARRVAMPPTEDDGCAVQFTSDGKEEPANLRITTPQGSLVRDKDLVLMVTARGKIYHTATFRQGSEDFLTLQIPQKDLPEGVVHISLLTSAGDLLASRDFTRMAASHVQTKVQTIKDRFEIREKIKLDVSLVDSKGQPIQGEFAVRVLNAPLFDSEQPVSLSDELNIFSNVMDRFTIDRSSPGGQEALDNNLIAATEDVPWKKILSRGLSKPLIPFTTALQKNGRAYIGDTGATVPDYTQITFYLQRDMMHYHTFALNKGRVGFAIHDIYGQDEFFYLAETKDAEIKNLKIDWDQDESIRLPKAPLSAETGKLDPYASYVTKKRLIDRSFGVYTSLDDLKGGKPNLNTSDAFEDEIMGSDLTINVQNYVQFQTMVDLIRDVIPSLFYRKSAGGGFVRVTLPEPMNETGDPIYVIDGTATRNTAFFLSLKPSDLLTVKIVKDPKKLLPLGLMGKNGIVIVQTKKGDMREFQDDATKLVEGLNRPVNFKPREHLQNNEAHRPDFRATLYWNPMVTTDTNGKATVEFFSSDDVGKLRVQIDGIATGGQPFSTIVELEVVATVRN